MDYRTHFTRECLCGQRAARSYDADGYCCGHCGRITALARPDVVIGELPRSSLRPARFAAAHGRWGSRHAPDRRGDGTRDRQAA